MLILISVRDTLEFLGIGRMNNANNKIANIIRRIICFLILLSAALSVIWFVIFEAKTFTEHAKPLIFLFSAIITILLFLILLQQSERNEKLFDNFLSKIQERMLLTYFRILLYRHLI